MSKLNVDQKTIKSLFQDKKTDFLIPDYQRPYAWGEAECQTLWDDIFAFAIPNNDATIFDSNDEYFLGPIVTFNNEDGYNEVIDGQQRLTTLMLLLRAFYASFGNMQDSASISTKSNIEKCIWKTDEFEKADKNQLKINSLVATDADKDEFISILKTGELSKNSRSQYAKNFIFFKNHIDEFKQNLAPYFAYLPNRIMNNCILLPIEAESQDTALRIFSTLNDRGKPLSDADIFKAQFYKFFSQIGKKDYFINEWKKLEELTNKIFNAQYGTPMDDLFTRYMYYLRAKKGIKYSTTEALRKFYEKDDYACLKDENTFNDLIKLASFWNDINNQDTSKFSDRVLKRLFVLNYAPNGMWNNIVSVYFMQNKDIDGRLDDEKFYNFLNKIIGFIWSYAITNPGVNALRTPIYPEMVNIINGVEVLFKDFKFDSEKLKDSLNNFVFTNGRPITKAMLSWWAFENENQELLSTEMSYEIEHIYAKNRADKEKTLNEIENLESLGNKSLLEKRINIRASDYRFEDKKRYYIGLNSIVGSKEKGTRIHELKSLANKDDFIEEDIIARKNKMIESFILFLQKNGLTK